MTTSSPRPTSATIARHLREHHQVPQAVLDGATAEEHLVWHAAEHRHRDPERLRHAHPAAAKRAKS